MPRAFDAASLGHGFRHARAKPGDVELHYVIGGAGDPLVLLSGWPQSLYSWRKLMPALAERYTVVAVDLPGLGNSEKPADGYDAATVARRVHELVASLGFARIRLVTHDIGTWVSFPYAHEFGDTLRCLVMMDAAIPGLYAIPPDPKLWHFAFHQVRDLPEALIAGRERVYLNWFFTNRSLVAGAIGPADLDEYERVYAAPGAMSASLEFYRQIPVSVQQNKAYAARGRLKMPLYVFGSDSPLGRVLVEHAPSLAEDVRAEVVPGSGHYIPEEKPGYLLERLLPFLARAA